MSGYFDHIVVCGYDQGAHMLLDMLVDDPNNRGRQLVVFGPGQRPDELRSEFILVSGDPTKEAELDKVRMSLAAAAVLVGPRSATPQRADASTILTAFTLRRYLEHRGEDDRRDPLYIVCEILDSENIDHARAAGADTVIETTRIGFTKMCQALEQRAGALGA